MTDPLILVKTMAPKYIKGAIDHLMRNRQELKLAENNGRLIFNSARTSVTWNIKYRRSPVSTMGDSTELTFARQDLWKQATLSSFAGYTATDTMTEMERLQNQGAQAIINRYSEIIPDKTAAVREAISDNMYADNSGSDNTLIGLESLLEDDGNTVAADVIAKPSDTYAGLSTVPGNYGGTWSAVKAVKPNATMATDWPYGTGNYEYDFYSPMLVNYSSTSWGTGGTSFIDNGEQAIRFALTLQGNRGSVEDVPSMFLCSPDLFLAFKESQAAKFRIDIPIAPTTEFGLSNTQVMNFEGVGIQSSYGVAPGIMYGWNPNCFEVEVLGPQLITVDGPNYDAPTARTLFRVYSYLQLRFYPRGFVKLAAYA